MTKDFWIGFLSCACLFLLINATPPINIGRNEEANFYAFIQKPTFQVFDSTPIVSSINIGQGLWVNNNGLRWVTKIGTSTYSVLLNKS